MKYDIINVVDVEATCWDQNDKKFSYVPEIIEIGISELEVETGNILYSDSIE